MEILNEQEATKINKMIRRYYMEQKDLENGKKTGEQTDGAPQNTLKNYKPLMDRKNRHKPNKSPTVTMIAPAPTVEV